MKIKEIITFLETIAPRCLQEDYDNSGLITGDANWPCKSALISLDCTEEIIAEAVSNNCNLVICHHPIVFKGLKNINGKTYVERTIIAAIKNDIAIFAIHTNLDNVISGVNGQIAKKLGLESTSILVPKNGNLRKLAVFVPSADKEKLLNALFDAGAGSIGNYSQCSFSAEGNGSFRPGENANPVVGEINKQELVEEEKVEVIFPSWLQTRILEAMRDNHPYEVVAHDIYALENNNQDTGSGIIGFLPKPMKVNEFFQLLKTVFDVPFIKHTKILKETVEKIAICGGAGSFLIPHAVKAGADIFITGDVKYHEYFDAEEQLIIADIGHYESEQFTIELLYDILSKKYTNFAVLKTGVNTNPVHYFG